MSNVQVDAGKSFYDRGSGRWAGEQFLRALKAGEMISPAHLRTGDTLRKDEWKFYDDALIEGAKIRLRLVQRLIDLGLVKTVPNGLAKTVMQYEKVTDMEPALVSMDGRARTEGDRQEFSMNNIPLPIVHKDFYLGIRTLLASRTGSTPLDTMQAQTAGRLVAEAVEDMCFNGLTKNYGGLPTYGLATHPDRNVVHFSDVAWDNANASGEDILTDVLACMKAANTDGMYGPFELFVPPAYALKLEQDFKAASDKTIRQRLLEIDGLKEITVADKNPAGHVYLVQMTSDVIELVEGEALQTVQWDIEGGMQVNFKAFAIQVPLIRSTSKLKSETTYSVGNSATTYQSGVVDLHAA